ncbi:Neuropeptide Y receptor type 1, partial [Ophiophagus hannah]
MENIWVALDLFIPGLRIFADLMLHMLNIVCKGAIERHQLIINPRGWRPNNRHAYVGIATIWILAIASSLPFLVYHILTDEPFTNITIEDYKGKYIYIRLKRRCNMVDKMRDNKYRSTETKRINIMLISIVVAFAVCWLPLTIFNTVFDWNHEILPAACSHNLLFLICHLTAMISTCVNPIFYGFLNKNFQRDLQIFFRFCDFHTRVDDYETIAMSTMHTDISKTSLKQASPLTFKKFNDHDTCEESLLGELNGPVLKVVIIMAL